MDEARHVAFAKTLLSNLCKGLLMQGPIVLQAPLHKEAEHRDKKSVWQIICAYIVRYLSTHTEFRLKCSGSFMPTAAWH